MSFIALHGIGYAESRFIPVGSNLKASHGDRDDPSRRVQNVIKREARGMYADYIDGAPRLEISWTGVAGEVYIFPYRGNG